MIGQLRGTLLEENNDGTLVIDVGGVGYDVIAPMGTAGRLRATPGPVVLYIHTHVREDALQLYGFMAPSERALFRQLTSVSSIGPKTAITILGAMGAAELMGHIVAGETKRLTALPGVGKKTAERLTLELKDKLASLLPSGAARGAPRSAGSGAELLHSALSQLGFRPAEIERAIDGLRERLDTPIGELVRDALRILSK